MSLQVVDESYSGANARRHAVDQKRRIFPRSADRVDDRLVVVRKGCRLDQVDACNIAGFVDTHEVASRELAFLRLAHGCRYWVRRLDPFYASDTVTFQILWWHLLAVVGAYRWRWWHVARRRWRNRGWCRCRVLLRSAATCRCKQHSKNSHGPHHALHSVAIARCVHRCKRGAAPRC